MSIRPLSAEPRAEAGKGAARKIRRTGMVPGVIYGDGKPPVIITMDPRFLFAEMYRPGFAAQLFDLKVGDETHRVVPRDVQMHPVKELLVHVDFMRVGSKTRIHADVTVDFINQEASPGLKRGGVMNIVRHAVELIGIPDQIPSQLTVDLTGLDIGDSIHASALTLPNGVDLAITDRDFTIATLVAPSGMKSEEGAEGEESEE